MAITWRHKFCKVFKQMKLKSFFGKKIASGKTLCVAPKLQRVRGETKMYIVHSLARFSTGVGQNLTL